MSYRNSSEAGQKLRVYTKYKPLQSIERSGGAPVHGDDKADDPAGLNQFLLNTFPPFCHGHTDTEDNNFVDDVRRQPTVQKQQNECPILKGSLYPHKMFI